MPAARKWVAEEFYPGEQTLSSLRLNRGFTQLELANKIGVPQSTIARIETGNNTPSVERAGEIAHALGVSLDEYYAAFKVSRQGKSV
ncbi:XRE family transcriptional regulator [Alcaligenes faecalis]|nr:XRE family transcriptional regulator [Alcaligenes faecalis]AYZ93584.1 XRE family transcriptional regulator [Alcaligenes faecalis]QQC34462.1 helix-turn-helix transcriptional regulator [Alcaligenes faecalis]